MSRFDPELTLVPERGGLTVYAVGCLGHILAEDWVPLDPFSDRTRRAGEWLERQAGVPAERVIQAVATARAESPEPVNEAVPPRLAPETPSSDPRALDGASFIFDASDEQAAVWGSGARVAWSAGEPCILAGPQGVGKSTIAQQLVLRRIGLYDASLCDLAIEIDNRPALYVAADRPKQISRSFRRMVTEEHRAVLAERLVVWRGPPPFDLATDPQRLVGWVRSAAGGEIGTVVLDSLKDMVSDLSKEDIGHRVARALGALVGEGVETLAVHHQRKATSENRVPRKLADVYGSTWITAGAGSVLLLWGEPGDPLVELRHLKQPVEEVGPLVLAHDHMRGQVRVQTRDLAQLVAQAPEGLSAGEAAKQLYGRSRATNAEREKARRRLDSLVDAGILRRQPGTPGGSTRYLVGEASA